MLNQKLNLLFTKLTNEELNRIESSGIDMGCELESSIVLRICNNVKIKNVCIKLNEAVIDN